MASPSKKAAEQPSFLPDDLIEDILARMPAKSVQRCRTLSRAWASALSSEGFVDRHLHLANRRGSPRLFILPDHSSRDCTVHSWSPDRPLVVALRDERLRRVRAVTGQCRGIVVLQADSPSPLHFNPNSKPNYNYFACNPSTGQITALPKSKEEAFGMWPDNHHNMGIGHDTRIRKNKVVRLYRRGELPPACEVYVLNSPGQWRPPAGAFNRTIPPGFATNWITHKSVFAQGHLYWVALVHSNFSDKRIIMSFSINHEEFDILPPPPIQMYVPKIIELHGHLCLFNNGGDQYRRSYDIWVLRDHGASTWDLHCRIDMGTTPLADRQLIGSWGFIPLGSVDDIRRILLRTNPDRISSKNPEIHQLFVYRPATGDVEDLLSCGGMIAHDTMTRRFAALYEESLESTGGLCDTKSQS